MHSICNIRPCERKFTYSATTVESAAVESAAAAAAAASAAAAAESAAAAAAIESALAFSAPAFPQDANDTQAATTASIITDLAKVFIIIRIKKLNLFGGKDTTSFYELYLFLHFFLKKFHLQQEYLTLRIS